MPPLTDAAAFDRATEPLLRILNREQAMQIVDFHGDEALQVFLIIVLIAVVYFAFRTLWRRYVVVGLIIVAAALGVFLFYQNDSLPKPTSRGFPKSVQDGLEAIDREHDAKEPSANP